MIGSLLGLGLTLGENIVEIAQPETLPQTVDWLRKDTPPQPEVVEEVFKTTKLQSFTVLFLTVVLLLVLTQSGFILDIAQNTSIPFSMMQGVINFNNSPLNAQCNILKHIINTTSMLKNNVNFRTLVNEWMLQQQENPDPLVKGTVEFIASAINNL